jgi:hypothetical protein
VSYGDFKTLEQAIAAFDLIITNDYHLFVATPPIEPSPGLSRKVYSHLSKTMATQVEMTNEWLKEQGLLSICDL